MQALMAAERIDDQDIPRPQRLPHRPLPAWLADAASREEGLYRAHVQGGLSMTSIAAGLGLSVSRVSRLSAKFESQNHTPRRPEAQRETGRSLTSFDA